MKLTDFVVKFLINKKIKHVFGYPGGMITHFMDSFEKYKDKRYENNKIVKDYKSLLEYFISEQKKRGRTYTNALVKIGLIDEKRKITEVGEALLDGDTKQDDIEKMNILKNLNKSMIKLVLS